MTFMTIRPPVYPFLWMSDPQKAFSFRGLRLPDLLTRGSALDPSGGSAPRPVIGSRSAPGSVHAWTQYFMRGRIYVLYMSKESFLSSLLKFLLTIPVTDLALAADLTHCITSPHSNLTRARRKGPIGYNGTPQIHPQNCPFLSTITTPI